ncbi:MAG: MoaD/ThiS family protein [Planctomycetia bacterium]|nr:MoaD/ThiS family protein [Planctomycetia bacterium]
MPLVRFPPHLRHQFPLPENCSAEGKTVAEVVADLERRFPGVRGYILDDQGAVRQHVNIFVGNDFLRDRRKLSDPVGPEAKVYVMQALSGG